MLGKHTEDLTEADVRDMAVRYLSRREYGIEELRRKLVQRGSKPDVAENVVGLCVEQNLVSDERFAEMYVRMRIRRHFGPLKIRGELLQRGIGDQVIANSMKVEQDVWFDSAAYWVSRRVHSELDFSGRAKQHRSLMNRGFSHEQASVALDRLTDTP
jgi:regulatory protein